MPIAVRALVMLAAVLPLFAATAWRPSWWQTLLAAAIGSALGQVAVRATRGRRVAAWSVVGVAATVVALAVGWTFAHGARRDGASGDGFLVIRSSGNSSLTWDDVRAIATEVPAVRVAAYLHAAVELATAEQNWKTDLVGTTPDYFDIRGLRVAAGARFDASASGTDQQVVVLGATVVAQLFDAARSPIGEVVRIKSKPFTVVGVLARQGMSPEGQDLDDVAIVPIEVYTSRIAGASKVRFGGAVLVSPASRGETARVEAELRNLLRDRHRLAPGDDDDFIIRSSNLE